MNRNEVHRRPDVARGQLVDEPIATDAQELGTDAQHVEMPRMLDMRATHWRLQRFFGAERQGVRLDNLHAAAMEPLLLPQLPEADRRGDVGHVVLETRRDNFVAPVAALVIALPGVPAHPV